jgi:hypothetical protein
MSAVLPRTLYVATISNGVLETADTLEGLLAVLAEIAEPEVDEDVTVWRGPKAVAVLHSDGTLTVPRPRVRLLLTGGTGQEGKAPGGTCCRGLFSLTRAAGGHRMGSGAGQKAYSCTDVRPGRG